MGLISNGTTIFDNGAMASGFGGSLVFISSATASASASIEFTLGSYKEYKFFFVNIHPSTDNVNFTVNFSTDNGSNYYVTKTTTFFRANHYENGTGGSVSYEAGQDLAQSTNEQNLMNAFGADADQNAGGYLQLFNPSSTTFVKHFIAVTSGTQDDNSVRVPYVAGYANTTSALTNIRFKMSSGNIDDGTIYMFGVN